MPYEATLFDMIKTVEREATSGHLKNKSVRGRDDKAFMVKKMTLMHFVILRNWMTILRKGKL